MTVTGRRTLAIDSGKWQVNGNKDGNYLNIYFRNARRNNNIMVGMLSSFITKRMSRDDNRRVTVKCDRGGTLELLHYQ